MCAHLCVCVCTCPVLSFRVLVRDRVSVLVNKCLHNSRYVVRTKSRLLYRDLCYQYRGQEYFKYQTTSLVICSSVGYLCKNLSHYTRNILSLPPSH